MAIIQGSNLGTFKKSLGGDTLQAYNGQNIIRKKPVSYNDAKTVKQLQQREVQKIAMSIAKRSRTVIDASFVERKQTSSRFNEFISQNITKGANAPFIRNIDGTITMEPSELKCSAGSHGLGVTITAGTTEANVTVESADNISTFATDRITVCYGAYATIDDTSSFFIKKVAESIRSDGNFNGPAYATAIPEAVGPTRFIFLFVNRADNKKQSNTISAETE